MRLRFLLLLLFSTFILGVQAAFIRNVPRELTQPDGTLLHCFASGDEFYSWLHDANGYTIVQNPQTGYYVYAQLVDDVLLPSSFVAGTVNPASVGITPHLNISTQQWQAKRDAFFKDVSPLSLDRNENINQGTINNLVVFIRFADDTNFSIPFSQVCSMFNDSLNANASLYNYFKYTSYNQLFIKSFFVPQPSGDLIISYQDSFPRSYYLKHSVTNPDGYYDTTDERTIREHALLQRAIQFVEDMIPTDLNLDYNNDGNVDNVCFIIKSSVADWAELLWPHRWSLYANETYIHGKRVWDYNFQLGNSPEYFTTSTLCHEMFHSLSAPDLYHYHDSTDYTPIGTWDLMAANGTPPQQTNAYMKYKYGNWIDEIPLITEPGIYTIYPLSSPTSYKTCYKLATQDENQFILIEYRNRNTPFDSEAPASGIVFYRINTLFNGNADYNGSDVLDEVYIFRRNGTVQENGSLFYANFKANTSRDEFNEDSNPYPFLSDGTPIPIQITNISSLADSMQFEVFATILQTPRLEQTNTISLYPNPASQYVTIDCHDIELLDASVSMYDMMGKMILRQTVNSQQTQLSISHLSSGLYFVKFYNRNNELSTFKVIKP